MTSDLFAGTYARGEAAVAASGQSWLNAMLEVEAALARACAEEELIGVDAAEAIATVCGEAMDGGIDVTAIAAEAGEHATAVIPLVNELRVRVGSELAPALHVGATSQDILDTAAMLVARRAVQVMLVDARAAARACAQLGQRYADAPTMARTVMQPALPMTFGRKATTWEDTISDAASGLESIVLASAAVQMGGPVGTRQPAIAARVARELGLVAAATPWHTNRVRVVQIAAAVGILAGALGKVARDVTLLSQGEVGEVHEGGPPGRGGSSAMAHKHNPVAAVSVLACTHRVPGLVATLLANMEQEHERAAGAWQAEWGTLSELLVLSGSAAAWAADMLSNLQVDVARMETNLRWLSGGEA